MKAFKPFLSGLLVLCLVFPMMPAYAARDLSETGNEKAVYHSIIIDTDPTDGYEGDYVVIYNPSVVASNSISTGNLTGLIETTVEPSVMPAPDRTQANTDMPIYKIDVDGALKELAETLEPGPKPEPKRESYTVGSTKIFEILENYSPTGSDTMEFKCLYVGEHCYIWTPVSSANNTYPLDEIDSSYAKMAADEFDSKFDLMQSSFGDHVTGSGDGKLHMLYYNIDEGWNGSGGYVAGFFYAYDYYYNDLPILNIDTYPGVYYQNPSSGNIYKRMDDTYNTMVHEYQHLINFSNTSGMDTWLNECFSAAAEEICYPGSSIVSRIQSWEDYYYSSNDDWLNPPAEFEYQTDFALHNGYSMYNWSNSIGDVLALYAQVSFFAQYLYTRFGNTIYKQISSAYSTSETNAITSATGVSCAELVKDFRVAVTANATQVQYGGIYGFKPQEGYDPSQYHDVENPYDLLSPVIFTGSSCTVKGGGAITVKPVGGVFNPPDSADSNLQYIGIKLSSPYTVTAISNNEAWGTVAVEDTKITATPADGYYVADYEVVSGTATATIRGNIVRVTPESDCTIRVIFAPKPSYTVSFVASGADEGSETALVYDEITLPATVSVNPDGWTYIGWTETRLPDETESKPAFYAPGAVYTVTGNATLYAVYSRVEEGVGAPIYELVSEAPSDWSGNYVISYRIVNSTSSPMYLMKGVSVGSNGTSIEGNGNASQYAVTGATLSGNTLCDVTDDYLFTMEPHGSYYSIQNVKTGAYLGINSSGYFAGYKTYTSGNCDWKPGTKTNASSATVAISSSYPIISFYIDGPYFWAGSSNNTAALYVRFWKEKNGDATYYTTDPVVTASEPAFKSQALALEGQIGVNFFLDLPQTAAYEYEGVDFAIDNVDGADASVPFSTDMPTNGSGYYQFTYYVRSIEMADTITATLHYAENGTAKTLEKTYSVKQYFETYDDYKDLFTEKQQAMTEATADFGHYIQAFLDTQRTWTVGTDYTEMDKHYTDYTAEDISAATTGLADYVTVKETGTNVTKINYTLVLDSDTELRVYFKPATGYTGTFTFTANGTPITENGEKISVGLQSDGRYMVSIRNIAAHELANVYTIKAVSDGDEASITVSALSYVQAILTSYAGNETAVNAAVAIWRYAMAAKEMISGN